VIFPDSLLIQLSLYLTCLLRGSTVFLLHHVGTECSPTMSIQGLPKYEYFNVTAPAEYVAYVEINRPKKLNAFCNQMWYEMKDIFTRLSSHPDVRAVILCSAGERAFTAGLDVQQASEGGVISGKGFADPARKAFAIRRHVFELQDCVTTVADCEKPVIALCHGITYGLGK
jgi:delta(3,5)-delta(2,4)-dienoyl-CoA isomerase